jgi:hypothetical protein
MRRSSSSNLRGPTPRELFPSRRFLHLRLATLRQAALGRHDHNAWRIAFSAQLYGQGGLAHVPVPSRHANGQVPR